MTINHTIGQELLKNLETLAEDKDYLEAVEEKFNTKDNELLIVRNAREHIEELTVFLCVCLICEHVEVSSLEENLIRHYYNNEKLLNLPKPYWEQCITTLNERKPKGSVL